MIIAHMYIPHYVIVYALHTQYIARTDAPFRGRCVSCRAGTLRQVRAIAEDVPAELVDSICTWSAAESDYMCCAVCSKLETLKTES